MREQLATLKSAMRSLWSKARTSHFVRDVLLLSGGTGVGQLIAVAVLPVLTRLYSPADFGLLTLFVSIVTILSVFTSFSYELMIMLSRSHRSASQLVWLISAMSSAIAGLLLIPIALFGQGFAESLGMPALAPWLYVVPPVIVITAIYQALRYWKMRLMQFAVVSQSMIVRSLAFAIFAPLFAFSPFTWPHGSGLIAAFIASEILKTVVLTESVRRSQTRELAPAHRRRIEVVARRHGSLAATRSITAGIGLIYDRIPELIISSFFGATTLGLFGMVERIVAAPSRLVSKAIGDVYRQRASVLHRTQGRFDVLTAKTIGATAAISFFPFLLAIVCAPKVSALVLGADWEATGHYAAILLVGEFFAFIITPIDDAALIVGAKRFIFYWSFIRMILMLGLVPLVQQGLLDFSGYLWGIVAVRTIMVCIYGFAALQFSRSGRPAFGAPFRLWPAEETSRRAGRSP